MVSDSSDTTQTQRPNLKPEPASFDVPVSLRGSTEHFNIYYHAYMDEVIGATIADGILQTCERDYQVLSGYFGDVTLTGLPFNVIILPYYGGAVHHSCAAFDLYCHSKTLPEVNVNFTRMLVISEESEVFMAAQARGWNCEASNGEGLSRVLGSFLYPGPFEDLVCAPLWLDTPDRPDFVNTSDPTDRNMISVGCSVLFLNYLHTQLHYGWDEIIQAAAPTLGQTYTLLTGATDGLDQFKALLQLHFPVGTPSQLKTDNPFPL